MSVCTIVKLLPLGTMDDLIHYYTWPSASCNSASGRPRHLGLIVLTNYTQTWNNMQHDHVLKKLNFDLIFATMVLYFVIPFNLKCNMTIFWKSWTLTYWPHPRVEGEGVLRQNIWHHVAALVILFNLIWNESMFWKGWILTYLPHPQGRGDGSRRVCRQNIWHRISAFMILLNLICNMTIFRKRGILTYWPHPQGRGEGAVGKTFRTMLLHSSFFLIWYATWLKKWNFDLLTPIPGSGDG